MIVVKIKGGLGNQMFQYAMARKLQMGLGIDRIGFDISRVNADLQRQFSLNHFRLCDSAGVMEEGSLRNVTRIQEDLTKRLVSYLVAGRPGASRKKPSAGRRNWRPRGKRSWSRCLDSLASYRRIIMRERKAAHFSKLIKIFL